jgi:hypothetical protein
VATEVERILKEAEQMQKQHGALLDALTSGTSYLEAAPDTVKAAANVLHEYLTGPEMDHPEDGAGADAAAQPTEKDAGADAHRSMVEQVVDKLTSLFTKSADNDKETEMTDEAKVTEEAVTEEKVTEEAAPAATEEAVTEEAVTEEPAAEVESPAVESAPAGDAAAAIQAGFESALTKAVEDIKAEFKAELAKRDEDVDATREALTKALDRVQKLEKGTARTQQPEGQDGDLEKADGKSVFEGAFRSRMAR